MSTALAAVITFFALWIVVPLLLALARIFGLYATVQERTARVYVLFGKVAGVLSEPGFHFLLLEIGPAAFIVNFFGRCYVLDLRLDQEYPRGSLRANVSNATVRCLSNMPLADMLQTRHQMSQTVRNEVSPQSQVWGYQLGSVYIRKVHFRDAEMIRQIEEKVVNRLRQVTAAIRQAGANQVSVIAS